MLLAGCVWDGSPDDAAERGDDLRPVFPAVTETTGATTRPADTAVGGGGSPSVAGTDTTTVTTTAHAAGGQPSTAPVTATITDPVGDATPSVLDPAPEWADLAGGTLTRTDNGFELRVELGGGRAPTTTDGDHTMNIASFYDVDGDGTIDYEVWANLASGGWGGSWFDNTKGTAKFGDDAGVTWTPEGDALVMRFPSSHLGNATRFRWSLASEWGRYEVLTTPASVRDDAPDDDRPASFNG